MATSFSGGRRWSFRREPPTIGKSLVSFITSDCESSAPIFRSPDSKGHMSYCHHWASVVRPSLTFHILINSSDAIGPIWTKLWWNGPWMTPFQIYVWWSRLPTKMTAKLKIEKRGDAILIVHCCFSISQNELKFKLQLHSKE
jgi:hypothetical protein